MSRYVALVDGRAGAYGVVIPDLPGCSSGGRTMDEAVRNAQEAISLWVGEMMNQGGKIPAPRTIEAAVVVFRTSPGATTLSAGSVWSSRVTSSPRERMNAVTLCGPPRVFNMRLAAVLSLHSTAAEHASSKVMTPSSTRFSAMGAYSNKSAAPYCSLRSRCSAPRSTRSASLPSPHPSLSAT